METPPPAPDGPRRRLTPLVAAIGLGLVLAVAAELRTGTGGQDRASALPGVFALMGAAATGLVLLLRFALLRLAGTRRG